MDNEIYQQHISVIKTPASELMNSELRQLLEESIRRLPEKYRMVFVMREIEGMNVADTQACLDISETNVKVRLNRAKSLLKELLHGYYKKEDILHFHLSRCDKVVEKVMSSIDTFARPTTQINTPH